MSNQLDVTVQQTVEAVVALAGRIARLEGRTPAAKAELAGLEAAPTAADDVTLGYSAGSLYLQDDGTRTLWQCVDNTEGAAVWAAVATSNDTLWIPVVDPATAGNLAVLTADGQLDDAGYAVVQSTGTANTVPRRDSSGTLGNISNSATAIAGSAVSGTGVSGTSTSGTGVYGASNGVAVDGYSPAGTAMRARAGSGIAVDADSASAAYITRYSTNGSPRSGIGRSNGVLLFLQSGIDGANSRQAQRKELGIVPDASADPDATFDATAGYTVGVMLFVPSTNRYWLCADNTNGAAVWKRFFFRGDVTIVEQIASLNDTYIREGIATSNNFASSTISASRQASSDTREFLMRFDLSGIPAEAIIDSATLTLTTKDADTAVDLIGYRLLVPYVADQATWNIRATATNWNTAGALGVGTDHDGTAVFQVAIPAAIDTAFDVDLSAIVQNWVDGTWDNYGFVAWAVDGGSTVLRDFHSSRASTAAFRPVLEVVYTL